MSARDVRAAEIDAVVIGASAGGVEALSILLPALRKGVHASILVVLHLPRDRPSRLVDIFSAKCAVPVREAQDKDPVEPGTIYIAPPDYHLLVDRGPELALSVDELVHFSRPSIDVLFESAADVYGSRLMGIVLTGANEDGSAGLAAIDRAGGWTVVQHPDAAQASLMVTSALRSCPAALALSVAEIARLLLRLPTDHAE